MFLFVVVAGRLLDGFVSGLAHRVHQRDPVASCLRHEAERSPWALNSAGSSPAIRQRFLRMRLIDCGVSALAPMEPSLRTSLKIGPEVMLAACMHS